LGLGFVSAQLQGCFKPAPSPKPRPNPKILAPHGRNIFLNAQNAVGDGVNVFIATPFHRRQTIEAKCLWLMGPPLSIFLPSPVQWSEMFYDLLGRLLFPRQPRWKRRKKVKTTLLTLAFAVTLGSVLATAISLMNLHSR
jgi:hypothetical protein